MTARATTTEQETTARATTNEQEAETTASATTTEQEAETTARATTTEQEAETTTTEQETGSVESLNKCVVIVLRSTLTLDPGKITGSSIIENKTGST
ncbi:10825_t:CDS:2 [Racocetra fulgida]|uniref:10825_t:CDS:1 n=1 Tax=Racocetra fulgida TaxID=60492 RepID=A0A9N8VI90_9GLOM|nr:10825_t:CDS:2 [Racocetra fulgida]